MSDFAYRPFVREAVARAKAELNGDDGRLKSAALELRMAIEALVCDRLTVTTDPTIL